MIKNVLPFLLLFFSLYCKGQNSLFFSSDEELSNSLINSIIQDSKGFIWIATENGLNRYDGHKFIHYHKGFKSVKSLKNNFVHYLFEDSKQRLWVTTLTGLQLFDRKTETFLSVHSSKKSAPPHLTKIIERKDGSLWASSHGYGIVNIAESNGYFMTVANQSINNLIKAKNINSLYEDSNGDLWIGTHGSGIFRLSNSNQTVSRLSLIGATNDCSVSDICEGTDGNIYISTFDNGVFQFSLSKKQFTKIYDTSSSKNYPCKKLYLLTNGQLIIGTDGAGIKKIDTKLNRIVDYKLIKAPFKIDHLKVHDFLEDREKNLWIGIYQKGVLMIPNSTNKFEYWGSKSLTNNIIGSNSVMSIFEDYKSRLWVGTDNDGLYSIDLTTNRSTHYLGNNPIKSVPSTIMSIFQDSQKNIWLGSYYDGAYKIDSQLKKCIPVYDSRLIKRNIINETISAFIEDNNHLLWMGTSNDGVIHYDLEKNSFVTKPINGKLTNQCVNTLLLDKQNNVWVGLAYGLNMYDNKNNQYVELRDNYSKIHEKAVFALLEDNNNQIWIGTDDGLIMYNKYSNEFSLYTQKDGLPSDMISALAQDVVGNIWITTRRGLCQYLCHQKTFISYFKSDGIQSNEFSRGAIFCSNKPKGKIYTGGIGGITIINPENFKEKRNNFNTYITDFYLLNKRKNEITSTDENDITNKPIIDSDLFQLQAEDNSFSVEFSALIYSLNDRLKYQYMLTGFDHDWITIPAGSKPVATYSKIPWGKYTLQLKISDQNNYSSIKSVVICIAPPWYLTWWGILIWCTLAIFVVAFIIHYYRSKEQNKKEKILLNHQKELDELKMQFFINISHELRTPLSLIVLPLEKLLESSGLNHGVLQNMWRNAQHILSLLNQMMDIRKIDKGQMKLKCTKIDLESFIDEIRQSFLVQAQIKNIDLTFIPRMEEIDAWIDIEQFRKIIYNILSNAFKFTPNGGQINISVTKIIKQNQSYIQIIIEDNGIGLSDEDIDLIFNRFYQSQRNPTHASGTGIGLHLSKVLITLHGGEIYAENRKDQTGSRFFVVFPEGYQHLSEECINFQDKYLNSFVFDKKESVSFDINKSIDYSKAKTKETILIVDDQFEMRQYLKEILSPDFYVIECNNGKRAYELILEMLPSIVLSDVVMPELDGGNLCKMIKRNINISDTPVVLLSGKSNTEDQIEGFDFGADAYLTKPFNIDVLKSILRNLLERKKRQGQQLLTEQIQEFKLNKPKMTNADEQLMNRIVMCVDQNITDSNFDVELLCTQIGISRVHLYRKLKELTSQSPIDFIRNIRLKMAADLLVEKKHCISEVAYKVGFSNVSHFSRTFKTFYGMSPRKYIDKHKKQ